MYRGVSAHLVGVRREPQFIDAEAALLGPGQPVDLQQPVQVPLQVVPHQLDLQAAERLVPDPLVQRNGEAVVGIVLRDFGFRELVHSPHQVEGVHLVRQGMQKIHHVASRERRPQPAGKIVIHVLGAIPQVGVDAGRVAEGVVDGGVGRGRTDEGVEPRHLLGGARVPAEVACQRLQLRLQFPEEVDGVGELPHLPQTPAPGRHQSDHQVLPLRVVHAARRPAPDVGQENRSPAFPSLPPPVLHQDPNVTEPGRVHHHTAKLQGRPGLLPGEARLNLQDPNVRFHT